MRIALPLILCLLLSFPAPASPNIQTGPAPGWLAVIHPDLGKTPPSREISGGYYLELLDVQTNLIHCTQYTHFIKHIVNESGVQDESEVSVTFSPEFQQLVFHRVCIWRDGVMLNQLQPARIKVVQEETEADDFQYNGLKRAFITLKDVRKGDRIEVSFSLIGFNPVFGKKYSDEVFFGSSTAICNYYRTILTSTDRHLNISTRNNAPIPDTLRLGNTLLYRWSNPPLKTWDSESTTPSWYNAYPTAYITEYDSWKEVVDWGLNTFNNYRYPLPASLQQKIAAWRKTAGGDKDQLANLATRFVQNEIRYLGLEIGVNTHRPHTPAEVYSGRFGDCKDKALLLSVILQHEGIPACVALINTNARRKLPTLAPAPTEFDHAIVAIERPKGAWLYVESDDLRSRGELVNLYVPAYGFALLLRDGDSSLQPIPVGLRNDYFVHERLDARYHDTSRFSVTTTYAGGAADKTRASFAENSIKDLEENYCKYYATEFEGIRQQTPVTYTDDSLKNEMTVNEQYAIPSLWTTGKDGKKSFDFSVKILSNYLTDPSDSPSGTPLELSYPINIRYTLELHLPENWEFGSGALHIKNESYQFDFTPSVEGKEMTLHYSLKTFGDQIPVEDLRQYKADYKNIADCIFFQLYKNNAADAASDEAARDENTRTEATRDETISPKEPAAVNGATLAPLQPKACWPAIWLSFFFCLLFSRLFGYLNARSEETLYAPGSGYPIGGWLIVLGITLVGNLLLQCRHFYQSGFYNYNNWTAYGKAGGSAMQFLLLSNLAIQLSFIACTGSVLFWLLKRRDIFPRMFIGYGGILLSGRLLLLLLFHLVDTPASLNGYKEGLSRQFLGTAVYAGVWVAYILRSEQVRRTFLEPFRERTR